MEKGSVPLSLISLSLFILFAIGAVVYLFNQNQQLRKLIPTPTPIASTTPTASPEPVVEPSVTASASASVRPAKTPLSTKTPDGSGVACTMDAKMCPDGSFVGRVPPLCQFAPCPTP